MNSRILPLTLCGLCLLAPRIGRAVTADSEIGLSHARLGVPEAPSESLPSAPPGSLTLAELRTTFWYESPVGFDFGAFIHAGGMLKGFSGPYQQMLLGAGLKIRIPPLLGLSPWMGVDFSHLALAPTQELVSYRASARMVQFHIGFEFDPGKPGPVFFNPEVSFFEYGSSSYTSGAFYLGIRY